MVPDVSPAASCVGYTGIIDGCCDDHVGGMPTDDEVAIEQVFPQ